VWIETNIRHPQRYAHPSQQAQPYPVSVGSDKIPTLWIRVSIHPPVLDVILSSEYQCRRYQMFRWISRNIYEQLNIRSTWFSWNHTFVIFLIIIVHLDHMLLFFYYYLSLIILIFIFSLSFFWVFCSFILTGAHVI